MKSIVTSLALLGAATAHIVGMTGPATVAPDSKISVTLITERNTEAIQDVVASFALAQQTGEAGSLGNAYLGSYFLGKGEQQITRYLGSIRTDHDTDNANSEANLTFTLATPSDLSGVAYLTGAVSSLYGSSHAPTTIQFAIPIEVSNAVGDRVNTDTKGIAGNCFERPLPSKRDTVCFPNSALASIAESQYYAQTLISDIATNTSRDGKTNLGELNGHLHDVFRAVDLKQQGEEACNNPQNLTWPALPSSADDHSRATTITNAILAGLDEIKGYVQQCRTTFIFKKACAVLEFAAEVEVYPWD